MFRILLLCSLAFLCSQSSAFAQSDSLRRTQGVEVTVTGFPGAEGVAPIPVEEIRQQRIELHNSISEPTKVAAFTPSATFQSQSGTDIGYTFLSIRGFEQRRLSILVNGVPQNDPEDHNVYWIDMPDLLSSTGRIQVQRGAGSAFYGPPAIGGSINVETAFPTERALSIYGGFGSYNTQKLAIEGSSGLFADNWMAHARLSSTTTDGYRNHSFVDLYSYHLSLKRIGVDHILQFNAFGGPIKDGLNYYGIFPHFGLGDFRDAEGRKYNVSDSYAYERRPEEQETFFQPHFELMSTYFIDPVTTLKNTFFYVQGEGEFDYDGTWTRSAARYFRLTRPYAESYGFKPIDDTVRLLGNELIRSFVGNKQFGWLPRLEWKYAQADIYAGAELRRHRSLHWGTLLQADNLPADLPTDYRFYEYTGGKDIFSPYGAINYRFEDGVSIFASMQLVAQKYLFENEKPHFVDTVMAQETGLTPGWRSHEFQVAYLFLNPRAGLGIELSDDLNAFASFGLTSREPRLGEYYRGEAFSEPNFPRLPSGRYDFNAPKIKPERLLDLELGLSLRSVELADDVRIKAAINGYLMKFTNELVKTGRKDLFGIDILTNAEETDHYGVEGSIDLSLFDRVSLDINAGMSRHRFIKFVSDTLDFSEQVPIGFPDVVLSGILSVQALEQLNIAMLGRYVGSTFGDLENSGLYRNPEYFVADMILTMKFPLEPIKFIEIKVQANNIFDRLYTSYADIGTGFFVAAPRHFFGSISLGI